MRASSSLPVRPRGAARPRRRTVARVSALSATRTIAALALLASSAALYALTVAPAFTVDPAAVTVAGARYTDPEAVRRVLGLGEGSSSNVFRLRTGELAQGVRGLPSVAGAQVRALLPDRLVVELEERRPILAWAVGERRFLVDVEGRLFAELPAGAAASLPIVTDRRAAAPAALDVRIDPVELEAVRKIAALTPSLLGSAAAGLRVSVDDEEGFTLDPRPAGWHAVLGLYTPNLRPPTLVEEQVACLRALLGRGETEVRTVYLFPERDRCGTFRPAPSPGPP